MPKYNVPITRDTTETTNVDVEANTPAEAEAEALRQARDNPGEFDWVQDDGVAGDPYIGDPGNAAEEIVPHDALCTICGENVHFQHGAGCPKGLK